MTNAAPYIRKALRQAVAGLSYGGTVPFYENEGGGDALQVVLGEIARADASTKNTNGGLYTVVLEVISEQDTAARKEVDELGALVMNAVSAGPRAQSLLLADPLQLVRVSLQSQNYLTEDSDAGRKIVRLILRYQFKVIETV